MRGQPSLADLWQSEMPLRQVEPGIVSAYPDDTHGNAYDQSGPLSFYDLVACNRFYNRLVWGYWPSVLARFYREALATGQGWVLDSGCGSLAFAATAYAARQDRPVVCLDQSLTLLRLAKKRLQRLLGAMPENIVLLHADARSTPFRRHSFATVMAFNLLHVMPDGARLLAELQRTLRPGGDLFCTTLVRAGRLADRYLAMWERAGELRGRSPKDVMALFDAQGLSATAGQQGNMLLVRATDRS